MEFGMLLRLVGIVNLRHMLCRLISIPGDWGDYVWEGGGKETPQNLLLAFEYLLTDIFQTGSTAVYILTTFRLHSA